MGLFLILKNSQNLRLINYMNNEIRSISNKMHERGLSSDKQEFGSFYLLRFLGAKINFEPNQCIVSLESVPPMFNPKVLFMEE